MSIAMFLSLPLTVEALVQVRQHAARWQVSEVDAALRLLQRGLSVMTGASAGGLATAERSPEARQATGRAGAKARWKRCPMLGAHGRCLLDRGHGDICRF